MCKDTNQFTDPYLRVLRFGVCPICLQRGVASPTSNQGREIHYHCTNPACEAYMIDNSMPLEVFELLCYLEDHQPQST